MGSARIEWTDRTWNPVTGCTKVSAGCKHCYAEVMSRRFWAARGRSFNEVLCHENRLDNPLRWRKPARVFVNSMSDLFHEDVPDEFIDRVFAVMHMARRIGHVFQVLTKRPVRMLGYLSDRTRPIAIDQALMRVVNDYYVPSTMCLTQPTVPGGFEGWPLPNVWLGVSVEDQATANARIPLLLQTPAALRFVSYEPALGPVQIESWLVATGKNQGDDVCRDGERKLGAGPLDSSSTVPSQPRLDWLIVGGESGPEARTCDVAWIRSAVQQCKAAGCRCSSSSSGRPASRATPTLCGTTSGGRWRRPTSTRPSPSPLRVRYTDRKGADPSEWPPDLWVREMPEVRS